MNRKIRTVFVVGAGFSKYVGLPLTSQFTEALLEARQFRTGPSRILVEILAEFISEAFGHDRSANAKYLPDLEDLFTCGEPEAENLLVAFLHMNKLERFDVAVGSLGKTCDLVARLIFERLGAMLLDRSKPGWQLSLKLKAIRKGLSDRTVPPANLLSVMEYQELVGILDDFLST